MRALPALSENRYLRYLTFAALYFAQGVPWGFISVGYVVFLADQGLDNETVGAAISLAYLPWSFKIAWGLFVDRHPSRKYGRRRPYIVVAELFMGLTLIALMGLDSKTNLIAVGVVLLLHNICASLQDVAVDALAVDVLPLSERGKANSIMWAAKSAGVAAGGGGGTYLSQMVGWPVLFAAMAIIIWCIMLLPLFLREKPERLQELGEGPHAETEEIATLDLKQLWRSFSFTPPLVGVAIAFLTPFGYALIGTFTTRMLRADQGLSNDSIGLLSGIVEPVSGVVGALVGGVIADRLGFRKSIGLFMAGTAVVIFCFGSFPSHWGSMSFLIAYYIGLNLFIYAYNAATLGLFMTLSNPVVGATQFATYMAATNFCYSVTARAGGWMADNLGYSSTYFAAAAIQLMTIGLLPFCNPEEAERRFRAEAAPTEPDGKVR